MMDNPDCSALMSGGERQASGMSSAISLEEVVIVPSHQPQRVAVAGAASRSRNSLKSNCAWAHGIPSHIPSGRPASTKSISIPTLSPEMIRSRGSEAIAAVTDAPERSATSQSNADYVARDERGDPRGQKSGAGPGAANPRCPARAEGEKRFRSPTKNPYAAIQRVAWW